MLDNTQQPAVQLCGEYELGEFSRFTRGEYSKFMLMFSKTVAERTKPGQRQSIEENGILPTILIYPYCLGSFYLWFISTEMIASDL